VMCLSGPLLLNKSSRGTLAKIEAQVRRITDAEIELLAKALGVDVGRLYQ